MNLFDSLQQQDGQWPDVIRQLLPRTHAVDRDALRIWFGLWPLPWHALAQNPASRPQFEKFYQVNGAYRLLDQVDTSHEFLYGHRYWAVVKAAIGTARGGTDLRETVEAVAQASQAPAEFSLAMAAIGLMTLRQTGWDGWESPANAEAAKAVTNRVTARGHPADQVLRSRASDFAPSLGERLRGKRSTPRVICEEQTADGWFPLIPSQHITTAAELDKRPHHLRDPRCYEGMGIIPVDCRSGACGTCWVGVLGGQEKLSEITPFERQRMDYFGYFDAPGLDTESSRPLLRLACQAQAFGSVSIVIPPWNAVWGRSRRERAGEDATITL
ncbi:MAG: 2Fe-2S iron-sulfur cluster-binding protein [Acidobacteria bacterium]|nr:2Fe-2S iron-sulfur cluster-binding protein [Acidobacteriota bacterium]